jgi:hypothetical protein
VLFEPSGRYERSSELRQCIRASGARAMEPRGRRGSHQVKHQVENPFGGSQSGGVSPLECGGPRRFDTERSDMEVGCQPREKSCEDRRNPKDLSEEPSIYPRAQVLQTNDLTPRTVSLYVPHKSHISA